MHVSPNSDTTETARIPWNRDKLIGPKLPLKLREIWAIRIRLQLARRIRDLALFNLAIDSTLRGSDLVGLWVHDVAHGGRVISRATVVQRKTGHPVKFANPLSCSNDVEESRESMRLAAAKLRHERHYGRCVRCLSSQPAQDHARVLAQGTRETRSGKELDLVSTGSQD